MKVIPKIIADYIKYRDRNKCRSCGRHTKEGHLHHIYSRNAEFPYPKIIKLINNNQPENLLYLCHECHYKIHNGDIFISKEEYVKENIQRQKDWEMSDNVRDYILTHKSKVNL